MYALILAFALAQPAQAPPVKPSQAPEVKQSFPSYAQACNAKGTLITFLGCTPRQVANAGTICRADVLPGFVGPAVVVSRDGIWLATLGCHATDADIVAAMQRRVGSGELPWTPPDVAPTPWRWKVGNGQSAVPFRSAVVCST